ARLAAGEARGGAGRGGAGRGAGRGGGRGLPGGGGAQHRRPGAQVRHGGHRAGRPGGATPDRRGPAGPAAEPDQADRLGGAQQLAQGNRAAAPGRGRRDEHAERGGQPGRARRGAGLRHRCHRVRPARARLQAGAGERRHRPHPSPRGAADRPRPPGRARRVRAGRDAAQPGLGGPARRPRRRRRGGPAAARRCPDLGRPAHRRRGARCPRHRGTAPAGRPGGHRPLRRAGANVDAMASGAEHLRPRLHAYLVAHASPPDALPRDLIAETAARFPDRVVFQIGPEQGTFMTMLAGIMGARHAVEVGTFTGYSSICLARGLADGGKLLCCDVSAEWTAIARRYWERAGLADRIELRLGPGLDTLRALPSTAEIDLAFIDADKSGYLGYYEELLPRLRTNGLLIFDNVLWSGLVADAATTDDQTLALRALNDHVAADPRVETVMLGVADGLLLARQR